MIYDFRIYEPHPGKETALRKRFVEHVMPIFDRLGIVLVGAFAPNDDSSAIWYMTSFANEETRQQLWDLFKTDADWARIKSESEQNGPLLKSQTVTLLTSLIPTT